MSFFIPNGPTIPGSGNYNDLLVNNLNALNGGGGGGTPGGNNTNIQYNNNGSFEGSDRMEFSLTGSPLPPTIPIVLPLVGQITLGDINISNGLCQLKAKDSTISGSIGTNLGMSAGNGLDANGGNLLVTSGYAIGTGGDGGNVFIQSGRGADVGSGGSINIVPGDGGLVSGDGGQVIIVSGGPNSINKNGNSGYVVIHAQECGTTPGNIPGGISISAGNSTSGANTDGGGVFITAGSNGGGLTNNGGNVVLRTGAATVGTGVHGNIIFDVGGAIQYIWPINAPAVSQVLQVISVVGVSPIVITLGFV